MIVLENIKRIAEKAKGWRRPNDVEAFIRERKPQTFRFTDDGVIPNHPRWPLVIYKSAVRLPQSLDPAAVFEELFGSHGWGVLGGTASTTMFIIIRASMKSSASPGVSVGCNSEGPKEGLSPSRQGMWQSCRRGRAINALRLAVIFLWSALTCPQASTTSARH
jgi:hypothetical protein